MATSIAALDGPGGPVTIRRNGQGIPFVQSADVLGMFLGQGYATACDRLWHLDCDRRRALGTLASITGNRAHVITDSFARRARLADAARRGFEQFDDETQAVCRAVVDGINRRLTETVELSSAFRRLDAPQPEPFEPWHPVAIFLVRHITFATWQHKLWNARVLATMGSDAVHRFSREARSAVTPVIVPPDVWEANELLHHADLAAAAEWADELRPLGLSVNGSNAWVVHGSRTASGKPLIAGDPHRALEAPNVYYQIGLQATDEGIDAAGFSFPGIPGIGHFGQNTTTAWAVTNAMSDYQDLFIERLENAVIDRRVEVVDVRGGDPVEIECLLTRHGPVVVGSSETGIGLALAATGLDLPGGSLRAALPQLRARTVDELDAALSTWVEPVNNFVLADIDGDIAYRTAGKVPVRHPVNVWLPVPGWVETHDWQGVIPDAELPRSRNPQVGAIVTANQRVTTADYSYVLGVHPAAGNRATRIWERIGDLREITADEMAMVHSDDVSLPGERFAALAGGALAGWDGAMTSGSRQAALYTLARHALAKRLATLLPEALQHNPFREWEPPATSSPADLCVADAMAAWIQDNDAWLLPVGDTWEQWCAAALAEAEVELGDRTWSDLHHLTPLQLGERTRLDLGPISGAQDCVMATNDVVGVSTNALTGSTARYVWDLADRSRSGWVVPLGSDESEGPHHLDQVNAYLTTTLHSVWPDLLG
jgi:penicillin G amidase